MDSWSFPELRLYPPDPGLERDILDAIRKVRTSSGSARSAVESDLRRIYHQLVIREQHPFARVAGAEGPIWYVLRDGRAHPPYKRVDRVYRALWEARQECGRSRGALLRARALATELSRLNHGVASAPSRLNGRST